MADTDHPIRPGSGQSQAETSGKPAPARGGSSRSSTTLDLARLNRLLSRLAGNEFRIEVLVGEELTGMDESTLTAMARCYARLAREKWSENWSVESAREELTKYFQAAEDRINIVSLVFRGDEVVGLCWAFMFSASNPGNLAAHFASSQPGDSDTLEATRDWISQVGGREKMVSIRELGVLGQYPRIRAPLLCAPVYARARQFNCKYIFLRTPVSSNSLKWSLGIGFVPVHYFVVNQMLLMLGDLENTVRDYEFRILDYFAEQLSAILSMDRDFEEIMQQTELDYTEKMKVMQGLSASIAHEMRTPLSGVRASMEGMGSYLTRLLDVYCEAASQDPDKVPPIRDDHLKTLQRTPERIALMIDQANSVIDMLLMNLRDNTVDKRQFGIYSAGECILQALDRYPFKRGERDKVRVDLENDFYFRGVDSLFIYVIFNLLKNALYSINAALKGEITISLRPDQGTNSIVFRDTGEGIEAHDMDRIFDRFFSTRELGTGVGLAFCLRTLRSFGGDMSCTSEPGAYAEFTLSLPAT